MTRRTHTKLAIVVEDFGSPDVMIVSGYARQPMIVCRGARGRWVLPVPVRGVANGCRVGGGWCGERPPLPEILAMLAPPPRRRWWRSAEHRRALRRSLRRRQGGRCFYCRSLMPLDAVTIDHRLARASGGSNRRSNLVAACVGCNQAKQNLSEAVFMRMISGLVELSLAIDGMNVTWLSLLKRARGRRLGALEASH